MVELINICSLETKIKQIGGETNLGDNKVPIHKRKNNTKEMKKQLKEY